MSLDSRKITALDEGWLKLQWCWPAGWGCCSIHVAIGCPTRGSQIVGMTYRERVIEGWIPLQADNNIHNGTVWRDRSQIVRTEIVGCYARLVRGSFRIQPRSRWVGQARRLADTSVTSGSVSLLVRISVTDGIVVFVLAPLAPRGLAGARNMISTQTIETPLVLKICLQAATSVTLEQLTNEWDFW